MLHTLTLTELQKKLAQNEISSVEIVDALEKRSAKIEPAIHAFTHQFFGEARTEAKRADEARARKDPLGPLHGLPLTIKESIATTGQDVTLGIQARRGRPAEDDAVVVKIMKRAGAIVIGKTNISQTLLFHEADN